MAVIMESKPPASQAWYRRRKFLIMGGLGLAAILALAIGLGAGLSSARRGGGHGEDWTTSTSTPSATGAATSSAFPTASSVPTGSVSWQPQKGVTWNYQLLHPLDNPSRNGIDVWDIDLFDNSIETITSLQSQGAKVICYFSAGSYEDWRSDKSRFLKSDLGKPLDGWAGERWLDIRSSNVRQIMESRLDLAVQKHCDGVDPDNIDGYNNDNGLSLTPQYSTDFMNFLADAAHQRGLSIGLKNSAEIIPNIIDKMQWSVNEQCVHYKECEDYSAFIEQGKPVFHVEYPKGANTNNNFAVSSSTRQSICDGATVEGFSTIIKNMNLDTWIQTC